MNETQVVRRQRSGFLRKPFNRALVEEELAQPILTQNPAHFTVGEEGDEHNEHDQRDTNDSLQRSTADLGNALRERPVVKEADDADLENLEKCQEHSKQ